VLELDHLERQPEFLEERRVHRSPAILFVSLNFRMQHILLMMLAAMLTTACSDKETIEDFHDRTVTLPDGAEIRAEVMTRDQDMMRGMMFRDSFPEGRGMLFIHGSPGKHHYWMYQVKVPLDIIWMDNSGRVVEMSENTPPCKAEKASECPNYGGNETSVVVLELPAGNARKHGIDVGDSIRF
jgi:uncharacterized membrane protein (UPF0127 family)